MRTILFLSLALFAFQSNAQEKPEYPKPNPEMKRFVYQSKSTILITPYDSSSFDYDFAKGNKLVFAFTFKAKEYEMIADDEFQESIYFEIPAPKGNSFSLTSAQFQEAKVFYTKGCFCSDRGARKLYDGFITGQKLKNNTWVVNIDVQIEPKPAGSSPSLNRKIKGYFKPGNIRF